jgi:AcrR family transcriptional regulator
MRKAASEAGPRARARRAPEPGERKRDPERTREKILDAATAEFSDRGFAGARVARIAARAGVNKQLIAYYFGGKEGLYRAIEDRWNRRETEADHRALSLSELARSHVPGSEDRRALTRLLFWHGLAGEEGSPWGPASRARIEEALGDLQRRQESGELPGDLDPTCFLLAFMAAAAAPVILPQVARVLFDEDPASPELATRYAEQLGRMVDHLGERGTR